MKIQIEKVCKDYFPPAGAPLKVLDEISLDVDEGDFVMILGKSGCGKSTLLNIVAGLTAASSGTVRADGKIVRSPDPSISILFQQPSLLPWLNVEENIAFGCKLRGDTENLSYRVHQFIEVIGLSGFEKSKPYELSVGMAYRVCLARALVGRPEVFLLDEPFASLDTFTRTRLQEELINIWLSERFTSIFVTHDIDEAILLGRKIVLLGGAPCRVQEIIEIDSPYPRKITDESFFRFKLDIIRKFKKAFLPKTG